MRRYTYYTGSDFTKSVPQLKDREQSKKKLPDRGRRYSIKKTAALEFRTPNELNAQKLRKHLDPGVFLRIWEPGYWGYNVVRMVIVLILQATT